MIIATARSGEHLVVVSSADDDVLGSFTAPDPPVMEVPGPPTRPRDTTSFLTASYRRAVSSYATVLRRDRAALDLRQRGELEAWAARSAARVAATIRQQPTARGNRLAAAIGTAVTAIATLQQTGVRTGSRRTIAILGLAAATGVPLVLRAGLLGATVVAAGFSGSSDDDAALQADLLQAGAARAVVLGPATDSQLVGVVDRGFDGTVSYQLARINYGPAQYRLPSTAEAPLMEVLRLLTVRYPGATATIGGYTDDIPIPGGNVELSWKRADAVLTWLVQHGLAPSRLQAVGHGAEDPIAPNQPGGQPLNRRVVIVIEPAP